MEKALLNPVTAEAAKAEAETALVDSTGERIKPQATGLVDSSGAPLSVGEP